MAHVRRYSLSARNAKADALARLLDGGFFDVYDGTQPATAYTAVTMQTRLASLTVANPSAPAASGGVLTITLTRDDDADASGTAAWFRVWKADHTTPIFDGSVGVRDSPTYGDRYDLEMDSVELRRHAIVQIDSFTYTEPGTE